MDSYKIIITPDAEDDLVELRNYIADVLLARDTARNYIHAIWKEIGTLLVSSFTFACFWKKAIP